jgi:hypothetical protein
MKTFYYNREKNVIDVDSIVSSKVVVKVVVLNVAENKKAIKPLF